MKKLYIDIETYNAKTDLRTQGLYRYAEDAEIMLVGYAVDDAPAKVWDVHAESLPAELMAFVRSDRSAEYEVIAHNAAFERTVFKHNQDDAIFWRLAYYPGWHCTMAQAQLHGLPGSLQALSDVFKLPYDEAKDKEGRQLILRFCKPLSDGTRATRATHLAEWKKFMEYCRKDVEAERALYKKIPKWNCTPFERMVYEEDRMINDRGFRVDVELAEAAVKILETEKQHRDNKVWESTGGGVTSVTQCDKLLEHILTAYGISLPDMTNSTLTRRMNDPDLSPAVKNLITLRLEGAGTATKKYAALLKSVSSDGRLRGTLSYCGASRTGRWSGKIFQPQNLRRPMFPADEIEIGIKAVKAGVSDLIYDSVTPILSSALRGVIFAPEGKKLVVADLSSIEGRVLAWLAGEDWKVRVYAECDLGKGYDMYVHTYSRTFRKRPEDVTKQERQLGKVLELALGYGGGVKGIVAFAADYRIDLAQLAADLSGYPMAARHLAKDAWDRAAEEDMTFGLTMQEYMVCECIKRKWRVANPAIVSFWAAIENAVKDVVGKRLQKATVGKCEIDKAASWLRIKLPSGRYLCYGGVGVDGRGAITYWGVHQYSRKMVKLDTYGGKLAENITQAVSRDIFACGMVGAERAGYDVVLSVHDELIAETPDDGAFTAKWLSGIMASAPEWAEGLPLAAEGFESYRYRKG